MHPNIRCNTTKHTNKKNLKKTADDSGRWARWSSAGPARTVAPAPADNSSGCSSFKAFAVTSAGIVQTHIVLRQKQTDLAASTALLIGEKVKVHSRWRLFSFIQFPFMTKVMFKRKQAIPENCCKRLHYFKCKFALSVLMFFVCYNAESTRSSSSPSPRSLTGFTWLNTAHISGDRKWIRKMAQCDRNVIFLPLPHLWK